MATLRARPELLRGTSPVNQRYHSIQNVLSAIRKVLVVGRVRSRVDAGEVLEQVADLLCTGRNYRWVEIYLTAGERTSTSEITEADPDNFTAVTFKFRIRIANHTLGVIVIEPFKAEFAGSKERVLMEQVAKLLARYLTLDRGKGLLRKARENSRATAAAALESRQPELAKRQSAASTAIPG